MFVVLANYARSLDRQLSLAKVQTTHRPSHDSVSTTTSSRSPSGTPEVEEVEEVEDSIEHITAQLRTVAFTPEKNHISKLGFSSVRSGMDAQKGTLRDRAFLAHVFQTYQRPNFWSPQALPVRPPSHARAAKI